MEKITRTERKSVEALAGYGILDSPNEPAFDLIVREAAALLGTPIALISLLDEHRQWFKAKIGLDAKETPRSISFCTHAVRGADVFVVEDARCDERFASNPLVSGEPGVRFYAGTPLVTPGGQRIGTLCVLDSKPHDVPTASEQEALVSLARKTMVLFEQRRAHNDRKAAPVW